MRSTPSTDAHRTKRSFQPSIDSFFVRADPSQQFNGHDRDNLSAVRSPALPASIQSSLLNVGMRVRKSVPEGYKTHKSLAVKQMHISGFMMNRQDRSNKENIGMDGEEDDMSSRPAELVPFCGLHKVGGVAQPPTLSWGAGAGAVQRPTDAHSLFRAKDFSDMDDNDFPINSSQESNTSTLSTDSMPARRFEGLRDSSRVAKRGYEHYSNSEEEIVGPTFSAFGPFAGYSAQPVGAVTGRSIAKPRSRRRATNQAMASMTGMSAMDPEDDFEEAAFLKPMEGEIEMGGV